jgi:ABC-type nitrate/sulfonate/bicarbonate transport system substrate-binding protein
MRPTFISLALALLVAAACAPAAGSPTPVPPKPAATAAPAKPGEKPAAQPLTPIKTIGLELNPTPDPLVAWIDVANELGLFQKYGLDIEIKRSGGGGPAKVQALVAGEADVAVSDIIAGFSGVYEGAGVRTIFVPSARFGWIIPAKKQYTQPSQLKGQQVGVPSLGGSSRFGGILAFKAFGVVDRDVRWQAVGGTVQMLTALFAGRVEAAVLSPTALPLLKGPDAADLHLLIPNTAVHTPPFPNFVILARDQWVQQNPEAAERYAKVFLEMSRTLAKDQAAFVRIARKFLPELTEDDAKDIWTSVTEAGMWAENGGINNASTQELLGTYFDVRGDQSNERLSRSEQVFNTAPLKRALDEMSVISGSNDVPDWYTR